MAPKLVGRRRRAPLRRDDFGGGPDGSLAIVDGNAHVVHMTPARVAGSLRYFVARVRLHDEEGFPARLALTSALKGEGVSYVTRSLAAVIAYDTDASVVVVDLNWTTPRTDGENAKPAGPTESDESLALIDAVNGASIDDVITSTTNPRLSLVRAGAVEPYRRPGLAADERLATALDAISARFDHVLLDLPPILASSEAMILSELADAYVLVIRQGVTTDQQVEAALDELQGSQSLGVVLNRVQSRVPKRLRRVLGV